MQPANAPVDEFDARAEALSLRKARLTAAHSKFRRSQLDAFKREIFALREEGATPTEIRMFLRRRRMPVALTTVIRWMDRHDEEYRSIYTAL